MVGMATRDVSLLERSGCNYSRVGMAILAVTVC